MKRLSPLVHEPVQLPFWYDVSNSALHCTTWQSETRGAAASRATTMAAAQTRRGCIWQALRRRQDTPAGEGGGWLYVVIARMCVWYMVGATADPGPLRRWRGFCWRAGNEAARGQ